MLRRRLSGDMITKGVNYYAHSLSEVERGGGVIGVIGGGEGGGGGGGGAGGRGGGVLGGGVGRKRHAAAHST